ncbi:MAG: glucokinase [Candidatus Rokubacteria bacterium]|nr:glucokinase [Candidatus Rokubacteria bacterium]
MILAGDVGGTKIVLAVLDPAQGMSIVREATLPSREIQSLESAVEAFLLGVPRLKVNAACVGVAGPVVDGRCAGTNLPWEIYERRLAAAANAPVRLVNDLEAAAHGVLTLPPEKFLILQPGTPNPGRNMALIAAGTGLGQACMVPDGQGYRVVPSEGGHADFAPRDELQMDLLRFLGAEFGHVSWERVLSGPGLANIYRFFQTRAAHAAPDWLRARLQREDAGGVVGEVGLLGHDPVCAEALDLFVSIYGAQAGNLALETLALGGLVVGGGIAPKIQAKLADGRFTAAFRDKGRLDSLLSTVPVRLALDPRAPLWGAARLAALMETT